MGQYILHCTMRGERVGMRIDCKSELTNDGITDNIIWELHQSPALKLKEYLDLTPDEQFHIVHKNSPYRGAESLVHDCHLFLDCVLLLLDLKACSW